MAYYCEADNAADRSMIQSEPLQHRRRSASTSEAGITNPRRQFDVAEVQEPYTCFELSYYEGLGLCAPGGAAELIESGATEMDGDIPVNPSGGCMGANPIGATALIRLAEARQQVTGKAGDHQVAGRQGRPGPGRRRLGEPPRRRRRQQHEELRESHDQPAVHHAGRASGPCDDL